jgi:hypothetical protein
VTRRGPHRRRTCPACATKRGYATEDEAIRAAISSSAKFGKPMRVYSCCGRFHITSKVNMKAAGIQVA